MVALIALGLRGFFRWTEPELLTHRRRADRRIILVRVLSLISSEKAMSSRSPEWSHQHVQSSWLSAFFVKGATNHMCPFSARSVKIAKAVAQEVK